MWLTDIRVSKPIKRGKNGMKKLYIYERFESLLPVKTAKAKAKLEEQMLADLTTEPVEWWHSVERDRDEIVEGHHRYSIAEKHAQIADRIQFHEKHFANDDEVAAYIIWHQLSRRNLTGDERKAFFAQAVELERPKHETVQEAVEAVAEVANVTPRTVFRGMQAVKMGYENRQSIGDELDQSMPEEGYDSMPDEYAQDIPQDDYSQVDERPADVPRPPRRKSKSKGTVNSQKSTLRAYETLLNKMQGLRVALTCPETLEPDYRAIFDSIEKFRSQMPQPKKKFGR